eukprot:jgi/Mesvir1/20129/Mv13368-RA.1
MSDNNFRQSVERKVLDYALTHADHPLNIPGPVRPVEVITGGMEGAVSRTEKTRTKIRFVPPAELENAIVQFEKGNDARMKRPLMVLTKKDTPVAVQYVYRHGQIKVQAKFKPSGDFVDWLFVARSRMLETKGIVQLGLYADRVIPGGACIGVMMGRVLGPPVIENQKPSPEQLVSRLRHLILDILGSSDKIFKQVVGSRAKVTLHVDGGRPGLGVGDAPGNTFHTNSMPFSVDYPGWYLHMANDPRGFDMETRPNAMLSQECGGLSFKTPCTHMRRLYFGTMRATRCKPSWRCTRETTKRR